MFIIDVEPLTVQAGGSGDADGPGHSVAVPSPGRGPVGEVLHAPQRWPQHHPHRALQLRQGVRPGAHRNQQTW